MAEFTLPKNSKVKAKGKVHKATGDAQRTCVGGFLKRPALQLV